MTSFTGRDAELLACPRCRGSLRAGGDALACGSCEALYEIRGGVPDLLPWSDGEPGREWSRWRDKLDLLQEWRRHTWDRSQKAESRQELADELTTRFFEFARVPDGGTVLEIGCGSGELRRYLPRHDYWGLDPLFAAPPNFGPAGESTSAVFLRGVGECLPLVDAAFSAVLLCETLDHCLDPARVLAEARRVLRPGGMLGVMQGLHVAPPIGRRLRASAGRLKARLLGRWRPSDADTKTNPLTRDALTALVSSALPVEGEATCGPVRFLRAFKPEPWT